MTNPIKDLRLRMRLSQAAFGQLLGRSYQTIRNWEAGIPAPPDMTHRLIELATSKGFADLALALSTGEWQVRRVFVPGEEIITQTKKPQPAVRDFGTELHQILDEILHCKSAQAIETAESVLRMCVSFARQQPAVPPGMPEPRRGRRTGTGR